MAKKEKFSRPPAAAAPACLLHIWLKADCLKILHIFHGSFNFMFYCTDWIFISTLKNWKWWIKSPSLILVTKSLIWPNIELNHLMSKYITRCNGTIFAILLKTTYILECNSLLTVECWQKALTSKWLKVRSIERTPSLSTYSITKLIWRRKKMLYV